MTCFSGNSVLRKKKEIVHLSTCTLFNNRPVSGSLCSSSVPCSGVFLFCPLRKLFCRCGGQLCLCVQQRPSATSGQKVTTLNGTKEGRQPAFVAGPIYLSFEWQSCLQKGGCSTRFENFLSLKISVFQFQFLSTVMFGLFLAFRWVECFVKCKWDFGASIFHKYPNTQRRYLNNYIMGHAMGTISRFQSTNFTPARIDNNSTTKPSSQISHLSVLSTKQKYSPHFHKTKA